MKKTSYLWSLVAMCFAVTLSAGFASCGDDDDDPEPTPTPVEPVDPTPQPVSSYLEPYQTWGATKATVKNYMKGYEVSEEDEDYIVFDGKNLEEMYYYEFDNSELVMSEVDFDIENMKKETLAAKLSAAKYELLLSSDTVEYYVSEDQKTLAGLMTSNYYEVVSLAYFDYEWMMNDNPGTGGGGTVGILFDAPYTQWGASMSAVKSNRTSKGYKLVDEDEESQMYAGKDQEYCSFYLFDEAQALEQAQVLILESVANETTVANYLTQNWGYSYDGSNQGYTYYMPASGSTFAVTMTEVLAEQNFVIVVFFDMPSSSRSMTDVTTMVPALKMTPELEASLQKMAIVGKMSKIQRNFKFKK